MRNNVDETWQNERTYRIAKSYSYRLAFWATFFGLVAIGCVLLTTPVYLTRINAQFIPVTTTVGAVGALFFGGYAWIIVQAFRTTVPAISVDRDGLWTSSQGKNLGLVAWNAIHKVKENPYIGELKLYGDHGQYLTKVEYAREGFDDIRTHIAETMAFTAKPYPIQYSAKRKFLVWFGAMGMACLAFAWFGPTADMKITGLAFAAFFFWSTILFFKHRMIVWSDKIEFRGFRGKTYAYSEIKELAIINVAFRDQEFSKVKIDLLNAPNRPIVVGFLNVDSLTLYRTLVMALRDDRRRQVIS